MVVWWVVLGRVGGEGVFSVLVLVGGVLSFFEVKRLLM
jgi:hypothetical protein